MREKPAVYLIRHRVSGKVYVGSAGNLSKRWSRHRADLRAGKHPNRHLQAAWTRYGEAAFDWIVVAFVEVTERIALEQRAIDALGACDPERGYNRATVAGASYGGGCRVWTDEMRAKQAASQRARPDLRRLQVGDECPHGHVIDGTYTRRRVGRTGVVSHSVRCQDCAREEARERQRRKRPADR